MYCDFYGFREKPFNITPDPGFLFLSSQHREAFAHLLYGIDHHVGFIALTGEVGAGKTTVIRTLLGQLANERYRTALIFNPCLSAVGLMQTINREFGLTGSQPDTAGLLEELNRFLLAENGAGRTVVLVVDEAQNLEPAVLEQVRLISNLETERDKLIQIILVGQPELRQLLVRPELRQLGQRIGVNCHLGAMDHGDSGDYIRHRLAVAGRRDAPLFTAGALKVIYRFSGGLPRLINLACDRALLLGFTREQVPVTATMARQACADVRLTEQGGAGLRRLLAPIMALLFVAAVVLVGSALVRSRSGSSASRLVPAMAVQHDFSAARRELATTPESESLRQAFNPLAALWRLPATARLAPGTSAELLIKLRGLEANRITTGVAELLKADTPALLEIALPGSGERRYLALLAAADGRVTVAPALRGRTTLTMAELEQLWTGRGYQLWRNYLDIPVPLKAGIRGDKVSRLQGLLRGAGVYGGPLNGTLDKATATAIREFQAARSLEGDGTLNRPTLFQLYRSGSGAAIPSLARKGSPS